MNVTIYKIDCFEAFHMSATGTYYSLSPWAGNGPGSSGEDDGGAEYILPKGYSVGPNASETEAFIWDPEGKRCELLGRTSPKLIGPKGGWMSLKKVTEA